MRSVLPIDYDDIEQQPVVETKNPMDQITSSNMLMRVHCQFPLFTDHDLNAYYLHSIKHINPFVFIPSAILYTGLFFCQCGLIGLGSFNGDTSPFVVRLLAVFGNLICDVLFCLISIYHYLRVSGRDHEAFMVQLKKWYSFRLEDSLVFGGVCVWSLLLIARVLEGQCASGTNLWQQQTCNPFADQGGIPAGMVTTLYSLPWIGQLFMRCISIQVLVMCYILSFAVVAFCVFYTSSSYYSYLDLFIIAIFINATFEITRRQRLSYVDTLMAIDQVKKEQQMQEVVQTLKLDRAEDEKRRVVQQLQFDRVDDEKRLKEAEAVQLRSLIGNVVHDLKTPLFAIEADLDMLKMCYSYLPEDVVHDATVRMHQQFNLDVDEKDIAPVAVFETMWSTLRFMVAAINRGQDYMKASHNIASVPSNATFELTDALSTASRCLHSIMPTGRHLIIHDLPTQLCHNPMLISDSHWLIENVLCLTSNAIKYSDSGDVDLMVTIESTPIVTTIVKDRASSMTGFKNVATPALVMNVPSELSLIVAIEDHGVGVPEELRETLFQPFRQAQRHAGGTGLGLYSLFKRMEALGGDCGVRARSDGQAGSVFWFSFPYRPDTSASLYESIETERLNDLLNENILELRSQTPTNGTVTSESNLTSSSSSLTGILPANSKQTGLRILVTDDAPSILKVCKRMLTTNGHTVDTAVNGNESLEKLKIKYMNQECDALMTDIQMPVMDGIECTKRFRVWEEAQQCLLDAQGLPRRPRFLIVGMSANCDAQTKQDALEAGMDSFCPKPFKYEDFKTIIATHNALTPAT